MFSELKAQAEAMVLGANDINGLLTCALRPSNVFGPGDSELVPFVLNLAKSGWAKVGFLSFLTICLIVICLLEDLFPFCQQ